MAGAQKLSEVAISGPGGSEGRTAASELRLRTGSSLVLAAVALAAALMGGWFLAVVWTGAATLVAAEWIAMTRARPDRPLLGIAVAGLPALQIAALSGSPGIAVVTAGLIVIATVVAAPGGRDRAWALGAYAVAAAIALVPSALRGDPGSGLAAILWLFAVVWGTDVAAYFIGRALGGPKLWPAVSPGKTWSGAAGGLLAGTVAGLGVVAAHDAWRGASGPLSGILLASAAASVASQLGDLGESAMKRRFGVKDSGQLIPGHGGAMDRLDGFGAVTLLIGIVALATAAGRSAGAP